MAIWAEIHCDVPSNERGDFNGTRLVCFTDVNANPARFVTSVSQLYPIAKAEGWKKIDGVGWVCPGCQKYIQS